MNVWEEDYKYTTLAYGCEIVSYVYVYDGVYVQKRFWGAHVEAQLEISV